MRYSDIFRLKDSMMEGNVISYISKKTGKNVGGSCTFQDYRNDKRG